MATTVKGRENCLVFRESTTEVFLLAAAILECKNTRRLGWIARSYQSSRACRYIQWRSADTFPANDSL